MKKINLFIVGTGLIGSNLLKQITQNSIRLKRDKHLSINLLGIANKKNMLLQTSSIKMHSWKNELIKRGYLSDMKDFIRQMKDMNQKNSIFVDCTASEEIPKYYRTIFDSDISIVTPNKKGNAGSMYQYKSIREAMRNKKVKFLYDTNVGAGLPIISTIKNLIDTGDQIVKIEGIFSGTLSYLFNNFTSRRTFSSLVKEAKELGYTEPDPRNDLNGLDFGRKLLIIAREIGLELELGQISIQNLIMEKINQASSVENFFQLLESQNDYFRDMKLQAEKKGNVLRYIGTLDIKDISNISCSLQIINTLHPFYSLSGSDNIVSIISRRYNKTPLIIRGPGAGGDITAAGVFANVLSIIN